jgi:hypothetical protein
MKITKILTQHRRDFTAQTVCEHCGHEQKIEGYDDDNFHRNVVPNIKCNACAKKAPLGARPFGTKYPEGLTV